MARLTGAWARRAAVPTPLVPLKPERDPQHLEPAPNIDVTVGMPLWAQVEAAPTLAEGLTTEGYGTPIGGGGPIDRTPHDPQFGVGGGHGQTIEQAQTVRTELQSVDLGAVAARHYQASVDRDGAPHLAIIHDTPGEGDSPQTLQIRERTGVGQPNDPYARTGKRQKRWYDRFIDMHWFDVEMRPMPIRNARVAQMQPPGGRTQYDSPWPTPAPMRATPDAFVPAQIRRTPETWGQPLSDDGTGTQLAGAVNQFGLTSWGL
jgi:hypothetical protein